MNNQQEWMTREAREFWEKAFCAMLMGRTFVATEGPTERVLARDFAIRNAQAYADAAMVPWRERFE